MCRNTFEQAEFKAMNTIFGFPRQLHDLVKPLLDRRLACAAICCGIGLGSPAAESTISACTYQTAGKDMSVAINAAILANPHAVIDARCFSAAADSKILTWGTNMFAKVSTPGELLLGGASVTVAMQQDVPSSWRIEGAGPGNTILKVIAGRGNLGAVFQIGRANNVQISNIEIDGNGTNEVVIPIQVQSSNGIWITSSYIHDGSSSNIGIDTNNPTVGSSQVHIEHNRIGATHGCDTFDVQISPLTKDYFVKDNFISGGHCYGIGADGSSYGMISGNDISGGDSADASGGIQIEATNGNASTIIVSNNLIHDFAPKVSGVYGIAFVIGHSGRSLSNVLIEGNTLANYAGRGIVAGFAGKDFSGGSCKNVTIKANTVHDVTLGGIRLIGCTLARVDGNTVYDVGTAGLNNDDQDAIAITNTSGFVVSGNLVSETRASRIIRAAITLDNSDTIGGSTSDGVVVDNYAKGTSGASINNAAGAGRVQVLTNHTDH
jgi:hypothetical protein